VDDPRLTLPIRYGNIFFFVGGDDEVWSPFNEFVSESGSEGRETARMEDDRWTTFPMRDASDFFIVDEDEESCVDVKSRSIQSAVG
jgi:hypothetical protein